MLYFLGLIVLQWVVFTIIGMKDDDDYYISSPVVKETFNTRGPLPYDFFKLDSTEQKTRLNKLYQIPSLKPMMIKE